MRQRTNDETAYQRHKEQTRRRQSDQSAAGRDIAPLPRVENPRRKARAKREFLYFAKVYFPDFFPLPFSRDHKRVIAKAERAVKSGGLFAMAMPRGSGKTTILTVLVLWAIICGWHPCVVLIAANAAQARRLLRNIKTALETNEALLADFPEVVFPIRQLEGVYNRKKGQTYNGHPTLMEWTADMIVLPAIARSRASGAMIVVAGIESGNLRGLVFAHPDGSQRRPTLFFGDDPQTRKSASSDIQNFRRLEILAGDVMYMAGPGKRIAGLMGCTVIRKGDMADTILDPQKHPQWQGERTRMLDRFPDRNDLWDEYAQIRAAEFRNAGDGGQATAFYAKNRAAMDAGADVPWPERHHPEELSGLQHAMNLFYRDRAAFYAECQNEPMEAETGGAGRLRADEIAARLNGRKHNSIPQRCEEITAYVDVHDRLLYYLVSAWEKNLTGYLIDYGTWPKQPELYFAMETARVTLPAAYPGGAKSGPIYAGLMALLPDLLARSYRRDDGTLMPISLCLVNSGYMPDAVARAIRALSRGPQLMPSIGLGIAAHRKPLTEYKPEPGVVFGRHWRKAQTRSTRLMTLEIDVNRWKSTFRDCLSIPVGEPGAYTAWGTDPARHRLWSDHTASEKPSAPVEGLYGSVEIWELPPDRPDNHWWDCGVGAAAAANLRGCGLAEWNTGPTRRDSHARPSLADLAGRK